MWGATFKPDGAVTQIRFQSTRPVWGATLVPESYLSPQDISIHAPRVGRDLLEYDQHVLLLAISIHAPRVGRDDVAAGLKQAAATFQSTRPVWGATNGRFLLTLSQTISIHAPRVGRDDTGKPSRGATGAFQSTRPVWGATRMRRQLSLPSIFQSTRPVWGAT